MNQTVYIYYFSGRIKTVLTGRCGVLLQPRVKLIGCRCGLAPEDRRTRITLVFSDPNPRVHEQIYDFYCFWLVAHVRSLEIYVFKHARSEFLPVSRSPGSRDADRSRYQTEHEHQPASDDCTDNRPDIHGNLAREELPDDNHLKDSVESERELSLEQ